MLAPRGRLIDWFRESCVTTPTLVASSPPSSRNELIPPIANWYPSVAGTALPSYTESTLRLKLTSMGCHPPRNPRRKLLLSVYSLTARGRSRVRPAVVVCELPSRRGMRRLPVLSPCRAKLSVFGSRNMLYDVPKSSLGRNHDVMGGEMLIPACIARSRSRPVSYPARRSRSLVATMPSGESVPYPRKSRTDVRSHLIDAALNG